MLTTDNPHAKPVATMNDQLSFAWRNFEDQQAIIRAADLKAGYLVTFLLFFGASTIPLGKEVFPKVHPVPTMQGIVGTLYLATYVGLAIGFAWSLYLISHVLMPRIARFSAAHTDIDVRLNASSEAADLISEAVDIDIRYGPRKLQPAGTLVLELPPETIVPLCAPALMSGDYPLISVADLQHHPLLRIHALGLARKHGRVFEGERQGPGDGKGA